MNARTIQHPGVEMRQIDMSDYRDAIIVNNAYIIGFADKGPIYDYSWITTQSQFLKIYGKPQTEAEKYLYYAVTSVLNNGGTPVVARMPYDNKQCKAYKGLAIRYSGITDDRTSSDQNIDNVKIYGWKDKPQVVQDFYPDYMGDEGVKAVFGTNAIPLSADVVVPLSTYSNIIAGEETLSGETLSAFSKTLSTYLTKENNYGEYVVDNSATICGVLKSLIGTNYSQGVYKDIKAKLDAVAASTILRYKQDDYPTGVVNGHDDLTTIHSNFTSVRALLSSDTNIWRETSGFTTSNYNINGIVYYKNITSDDEDLIDQQHPQSDRLKNIKLTKKFIFSDKFVGLKDEYKTTISCSLAFDTITNDPNFGFDGYNISNKSFDDKQYISATLSSSLEHGDGFFIAKGSDPDKTIRIDALKRYEELRKFVDERVKEENSKENDYKFNGVSLSALDIPISVLEQFYDDLDADEKLDTPIKSILSAVDNKNVAKFIKLFNSPIFYNTDSLNDYDGVNEANQVIIDSKVIAKSNLGYKNVIMLDSKEVTISNDQYDDLVTSQKFTDGDNIENEEVKNDINRRFRSDIRSANFMIVDKHKSIAAGEGSNEGIFVTIVDPYDGLKAQRLLYSGYTNDDLTNKENTATIDFYVKQNEIDWKQRIVDEIENQNSLQHVYNADELLIGEQKAGARFKNLMDQWSTPLTGGFYSDSISKNLGRLYHQIAIADVKPGQTEQESSIEKTYSSHIVVAVCRTLVDPANGRITVAVIESFFGSLFDEKDPATGESLYIGDLINKNSDYIEFYRNDFVKNPYVTDDPFAVRVPQIYMRNSQELKQAADTAGIDLSLYDTNDTYQNLIYDDEYITNIDSHGNYYFRWEDFSDLYIKAVINNCESLKYAKYDFLSFGEKLAKLAGKDKFDVSDPQYEQIYNDNFAKAEALRYSDDELTIVANDFTKGLELYSYSKLIKDLNHKANIYIFDKTDTVLYNNHPVGHFTSFSRKDSQKIIANTTGLAGEKQGTRSNVAKNFLIDMDRCIKFINNVDEVSIFFVVDAGISTIAQFCDDIVWDYYKKEKAFEPIKGGWITQGYDPEHDQNAQDREINSLEDVSTWRAVVGKLDQISKEIRKDCMTIIDAPRQLTLDGAAPKIRRSKPTNDWKTCVGDKLRWISGINSSYSAGYYNWLRVTDTFTGKAFWLPPTCKVIGNYMYLNIQNLPWLAPAGATYGVITGIHGVSHNPSYKEEDEIYLKSWNYIKQSPYEGFIIEGQKTTLTKNSAFNRVNVRTLFLDLERYVYNMSKNFKYTVNNQYTRQQYVQTLATKFNDYQSRSGIVDYKIICDDTNNTPETIDANELRASIYIKPSRLIEYILVDFICTKSGTNFEEIV